MKAADFDYVCPASLDEVCQQLESAAGDAKVLAGGQTLVPLLAMRLTRPALLVDINNVVELRSEEHTSELQSLMRISYAVFCLKKKIKEKIQYTTHKTRDITSATLSR